MSDNEVSGPLRRKAAKFGVLAVVVLIPAAALTAIAYVVATQGFGAGLNAVALMLLAAMGLTVISAWFSSRGEDSA